MSGGGRGSLAGGRTGNGRGVRVHGMTGNIPATCRFFGATPCHQRTRRLRTPSREVGQAARGPARPGARPARGRRAALSIFVILSAAIWRQRAETDSSLKTDDIFLPSSGRRPAGAGGGALVAKPG
jgi:hypothetical protein